MLFAIFSPFLFAAATPVLFRLWGRRAAIFSCLVPLGIFFYFLSRVPFIAAGKPERFTLEWVPSLQVSICFLLDGYSLLFGLLISGIGALVLFYSAAYFHSPRELMRFFTSVFVFMGSMLGIVFSDNLILLFIFWELTGIGSYFLIGFRRERPEARRAALQALLITAGGGLIMLAGIVVLGQMAASNRISEMVGHATVLRQHALYPMALLFILIGAFTKSAQFPFHFWLPGAMEAPTPVSAYLHSATMVKAGVYLLGRLHPILGYTTWWHVVVSAIGLLTFFWGVAVAYRENDLKRVLAYSTVSALGLMVLLFGLGSSIAIKAAVLFILVHSLYKAGLFLASGAIEHQTGSRSLAVLHGLAKKMPKTMFATILAAVSMSGLPPLLGFISKELVFEAKLQIPDLYIYLIAVGVLANGFTAAIAWRIAIKPFFGIGTRTTVGDVREAPALLWVPSFVLAILGLVFGLFPDIIVSAALAPALLSLKGEVLTVKVALWHGFNLTFLLSLASFMVGLVLYLVRNKLVKATAFLDSRHGSVGNWLFDTSLRRLLRFAEVTTKFQHGRPLPQHLTFMALFSCALIGWALSPTGATALADPSTFSITRYEISVLIVIVLAALLPIFSRSKLTAFASLGGVGYGIALIYGMYGAPDLAMTQITVESLSVLIFVLVAFRFPRVIWHSSGIALLRKAVVAGFFGACLSLITWLATQGHHTSHVSHYFSENSLLAAFGRNVVNVILVDFRAMDTFGEVTVVGIATIAILVLMGTLCKKKQEV